ncbi:Transcriptional regulator, AsnC family [Sinorhizobium sojae CCBAU 05684]|uniref:Transcriptional regulator, AsnC family n=2 Tax=Sinorhizobium sojae TaxID=716925 RepID=A0A249PFF2_9HYPH|nr:Transcriptional regulator, AsnC family [Sinorhizobium sojae CCBAU 05684]
MTKSTNTFGISPIRIDIMQVSDKDRELLAILSDNARMPTATLARRLGLSRTTVQARIERLERDGVIAGYGVRLSENYEKGLVKAHMLITIAPRALNRVTPELAAIREIRTLHSVSGSFDLIAIVAASSIGELDLLIDRIGEIEGVEKTLSSIILSTRIDR